MPSVQVFLLLIAVLVLVASLFWKERWNQCISLGLLMMAAAMIWGAK